MLNLITVKNRRILFFIIKSNHIKRIFNKECDLQSYSGDEKYMSFNRFTLVCMDNELFLYR